ncbi:MAG: Glu/Leu/Phe/Val dehydrogenase [Alphaproteobacteria bacterium]|nr:Glu/Leu/Phe/Val dehydrogenase [Alphaproteobacteria bacterium]
MNDAIPTVKAEDIKVERIDASAHPEFKNHEHLFKITAPTYGFTAFIGVHNTALGPGEGGIRYKHYGSEDEAVTDVLRLSEGMTLKSAAANLEAGGGKTVVMAIEGERKPTRTTLEALAHGLNAVNADKPLYYGAEDMNISEDDLAYMSDFTRFIKGAPSDNPEIVGGNPSPLTALGVFECMKVAVQEKFGEGQTLEGLTVALQGVGSVGGELARMLYDAGAKMVASDTNPAAFVALEREGIAIQRIELEEIYDVQADIFAPNAIGGTITRDVADRLHKAGVKIVCGAANNQERDQIGHIQSKKMLELGILYCPDFIVNSGGITWVNLVGGKSAEVRERVRTRTPQTLREVIRLQKESGNDMAHVAEDYALARVRSAEKRRAAEKGGDAAPRSAAV